MNMESLQSDWAIWLALVAAVIAVVMIIPILVKQTSGSKLKRVLVDMKEAHKALRKCTRTTANAENKLQKLSSNAGRVKPRVLQEAKEAVEDGQALTKILSDKLMVAENHVRRVIHDEFPPAKHDRMRARYLPQDVIDKRPLSF
jgi:exonuclease VII small subunit